MHEFTVLSSSFQRGCIAHMGELQRIGTPFEDAMRRDFTVNSMFYNINKGVVEDFTGRVSGHPQCVAPSCHVCPDHCSCWAA